MAGTPLPLRQGLFSPLSRLADLTSPHAWALAICVLALLLGVAMADDFGVWVDTYQQRAIGEANLQHLAGESGLNLLFPPSDRLYGPIVEAPLRLVERFLHADDSRSVYLVRHLLTHLFFLASGFAGYLLAWRLFGSRWLALFALLLFLLHPRIYAHSFFNSKDVPFLGMFMICLWLAHRAFGSFGKDGAIYGALAIYGAHALWGVAAGLLINLRIIGLVFVALVAFLCLCDVFTAGSRSERRRALAGGALFALTAIAVFFATMPYLWADPLERFMEVLRVMSAHPTDRSQLFQGELVLGSELPASYLPVWFGITTPPLALLLGAVGFAALVWRIASRLFPPTGVPGTLLRNTPLRFELLIVACFVLPVLAAIVLRPTLYNGWRHFYFLWAPFVLLATSGLRALTDAVRLLRPRFLPAWVPIAVAGGLAALCLAASVVALARLWPHPYLYFNVLVNRSGAPTPVHQRFHVGETFSLQYGYSHVLEALADRSAHPDAVFNIRPRTSERRERELARLGIAKPNSRDVELLRQSDQRRFKFDSNADPDFYLRGYGNYVTNPALFPPLLYERRLYGQPMLQLATPDLSRVDEAAANVYRAIYRDVAAGAPALRGDIDVYRGETAITWVKEACAAGDLNRTRDVTVVPLDAGRDRETLRAYGVRVFDACVWQAPLPAYAIAKFLFHGIGALVADDAYLEERRRRYLALAATLPAARSIFDVYLEDGTLFYVRTPCGRADTEAPFFVHVRPAHLGDIPQSRRRHGFEAMDFRFGGFDPLWHYASGDIFNDVCMATLALPDYPIASIGTGQYAAGGSSLWRVDIGGG